MARAKKFIAVIGNSHAGKSTIIQALTGCKNGVFRGAVEDRSTGKWIEVIAASPQERPISAAEVTKKMKRVTSDPNALGLVVALQPRYPTVRLSMEDVFEIAQKYRAKCHAFVIAEPHDDSKADGLEFRDVEERLSKFRIELPVQPLDARRFAHVNAAAIREIVGWF